MSIETIKNALTSLNEQIDKMEDQVAKYENLLEGSQRDLFGAPILSAANDAEGSVNAKKIADKLDKAINKVEKILKEG